MKIALYSPYLPKHFGGGEKHMLTTAWYLSQKHSVTLLLPQVGEQAREAIKEYEKLFGLDLSSIKLQKSGLARGTNNPWQNLQETRKFDAFFYLTDGSFFFTGSRKNVLHIQVPYTNKLTVLQQLKLATWNVRNANSEFTKNVVQTSWNTQVPFVHYPYADTSHIPFAPNSARNKQILSVGRFINPAHADLHSKRQDALIQAFIQGCVQYGWHEKGWKLVLVGAVEPDAIHRDFVKTLRRQAADWPIVFAHKVSHKALATFYKESELYWHAAGLDINEELQPAKVEHFGMAPLEAMAYGTIPLVTNKGGLKEVIGKVGEKSLLFESVDELVAKTADIIALKKNEKQELRVGVRAQAETFSLERFCATIDSMLGQK
jgi:glycosyltransferase involved in cell wall biosynthesis